MLSSLNRLTCIPCCFLWKKQVSFGINSSMCIPANREGDTLTNGGFLYKYHCRLAKTNFCSVFRAPGSPASLKNQLETIHRLRAHFGAPLFCHFSAAVTLGLPSLSDDTWHDPSVWMSLSKEFLYSTTRGYCHPFESLFPLSLKACILF